MSDKKFRLPKENAVEPEGVSARLIDDNDVEGHGLPTTAPPSAMPHRSPGHGGENIPTPVDDEDGPENLVRQ
jgi:hypothetical protein